MPNTYVALRTETVAVATGTVTFDLTGISGYTDLELVANVQATSSGQGLTMQFNNDNGVGSLYSNTGLRANGSTVVSFRQSNNINVLLSNIAEPPTSGGFGLYNAKFFNYANTNVFKTILVRSNSAAFAVETFVDLWRNTNAITSIKITISGGNIAVGSTFSLYGIANADQGAAKATGGMITEDSQYWYHTFGASGAFVPKQALTVDCLVLAGGGAGGSYAGGGGGAGGLRTATGLSLTTTPVSVTVGAGGTGATGLAGGNGVNSVFDTITSTGGGGGGGFAFNTNGVAGGSGGGATASNAGSATGGAASPSGQGNAGGNTSNGGVGAAAGGGGAGAVGGSSISSVVAGNGGAGLATSFSGASVTYAGGGGGGADTASGQTAGTGGVGGGGNGALTAPTAGTANTGGGGGGRWNPSAASANGGSGLVIVRYLKA